MKKYYQLFEDYFLDYGITGGPTLPDGSVMAGKIVEPESLPELFYDINVPDDATCPHFMSSDAVIASKKFTDLLHKIGVNNFQQFPVTLINPETGKKRDGYYLFNVIGLVRAADLDKSAYDLLMQGDVEGVDVPLVAFNEITLDHTKLRGLRMFRMAEDPTVLIIDENIKTALISNKPPEGWGIIFEEVDVT